jgi:hypothetical protein
MWKFLKELWSLKVQWAQTQKALHLLSKQSWSVEFLTALLVRAAKMYGSPIEMQLFDKDGRSIVIRVPEREDTKFKDDDIFQHLDDDVKIRQFMEQIGGK